MFFILKFHSIIKVSSLVNSFSKSFPLSYQNLKDLLSASLSYSNRVSFSVLSSSSSKSISVDSAANLIQQTELDFLWRMRMKWTVLIPLNSKRLLTALNVPQFFHLNDFELISDEKRKRFFLIYFHFRRIIIINAKIFHKTRKHLTPHFPSRHFPKYENARVRIMSEPNQSRKWLIK